MDNVFGGIYYELREKRVNAMIEHYGKEWFKNKKILEVGCGYGDMGYEFYKLGGCVTVSDVRQEHLDVVKSKYPELNIIKSDLDKEWVFDNDYDFIIHCGTLYHIKNYKENLINCMNNSKHIFLESIVSDSDDENFVEWTNEIGLDQSFNGPGCRPSEKNIEKIITDNGYQFERYFSSKLNMDSNVFDWEIKNTKWGNVYIDNKFYWLRRCWFIKK